MPYQSAGCYFTHFPVDLMINRFNLSNWNYSNESDLSPFILPDDSIVTIEDKYDLMTDRLRRLILKASPHARIQRKLE
jgi:hypothetical protein